MNWDIVDHDLGIHTPPSIKKLYIAVTRRTVPKVRKICMDEALRTNLGLVAEKTIGASMLVGCAITQLGKLQLWCIYITVDGLIPTYVLVWHHLTWGATLLPGFFLFLLQVNSRASIKGA